MVNLREELLYKLRHSTQKGCRLEIETVSVMIWSCNTNVRVF